MKFLVVLALALTLLLVPPAARADEPFYVGFNVSISDTFPTPQQKVSLYVEGPPSAPMQTFVYRDAEHFASLPSNRTIVPPSGLWTSEFSFGPAGVYVFRVTTDGITASNRTDAVTVAMLVVEVKRDDAEATASAILYLRSQARSASAEFERDVWTTVGAGVGLLALLLLGHVGREWRRISELLHPPPTKFEEDLKKHIRTRQK